jgi:Rod binding domain-containing protein
MNATASAAMMMAPASDLMAGKVKTPQATGNAGTAAKSAKEFEGVFISQFLGSMFSGIPTDSEFGGGQGEEMFRSMMTDQYAKQMEARGGFGLANAVQRQLLKHQEMPAPNDGAPISTAAAATPISVVTP